MKPPAPPPEVMRLIFEAVNRYDLSAIMAFWAEESIYDNPLFEKPAVGKTEVTGIIGDFLRNLQQAGETIRVDRITGSNPVLVEWNILREPLFRGVHIADFNEDGELAHVRIFVRNG